MTLSPDGSEDLFKHQSSLARIVEQRYDQTRHYFSSSSYPTLDAWNFPAQHIAEAISGRRLLNPSIDLSNPCNLNCPYCFIEEKGSLRKKRKPDELTLEETLAVIDDFFNNGATTVNLVGAGEPTIDPCFKEIVTYIHRRNMKTLVFTNGIRIADDRSLARWLVSREVSVVLKYNSEDPDIQDALVASKGYSCKRDSALQKLLEAGFSDCFPTRLGLDILALDAVADELPRVYRMARRLNIVPLIADFIPTGRTEGGSLQDDGLVILASRREDVSHAARLFNPLSAANAMALIKELQCIDQEVGIKAASGPSGYYGGGKCTQVLGLYVDILGAIWPCVARMQKSEYSDSKKPLGYLRAGDSPSACWKEHPYMTSLRLNYSGGCPYKRSIDFKL